MTITGNNGYSFGSLLKRFRTRARFTQRQVAEVVGVHRNAIGRWEQGDVLPRSKGIVLELARYLCLHEQETRQLLEASLTALVPHWYVPYHRNPYFTGRENLLSQLHVRLRAETTGQIQALSGLGGIGKTQLALEYIYRYALSYSAIFWIEAETAKDITYSMLAVADVLHLPESGWHETERSRIAEVQRWLTMHKDWLLIWDNVEDLDLLARYLPKARSGAILLTTRAQALGSLALNLQLEMMGQEEGMLFLLRRANLLPSDATGSHLQAFAAVQPAEYEAVKALVQTMGGLPLALDQVGAYIDETGFGLSDYVRHYEQHRLPLLTRRGTLVLDHPQSVATMFRLSYERVQQICPAAANLLKVCAFLAPEAIPDELFVEQALHLKSGSDEVAAEAVQFDLVLATLRRWSLVQYHIESQTLSLHRLMQAVLQDEMNNQEQQLWQRRAVHALNNRFPEYSHQVWEPCERLLPHVLKVAEATSLQERALASLLRKAADYLRERAQYEQAEQLYQRALQTGEQTLGVDHAQVASVLTSLAILYREQSKYEQAELLFLRALSIKERLLGRNHPEVALILTNLGLLYWKVGKYNEAASLHQQAQQISEELLGPEHPELAVPFLNLALVYWKLGKYRQAEPLCLRVITIWEQAYGLESPELTFALTGLGLLYIEQRRYTQAGQVLLRVLSLREQIWGETHPHVARAFLSLAYLAAKQGSFEKAEVLYDRCLQLMEQSLGPGHPYVADALYGLATVYDQQGNDQRAEPFYTRALAIREQSLGPDHPETAECLTGLRRLVAKQARREQADSSLQQAHAIPGARSGQAYPSVKHARSMHQRVFTRRRKPLGEMQHAPSISSLLQASLSQDASLLTIEQVRAMLKTRGWTLHLKQRRSRIYVYATRRVGKRTQSRYLAPLDDLAACSASAVALPNTVEL